MTAKEINLKMQDSRFLEEYGAEWVKVKHATKWQSGKGGASTLADGCEPDWEWSYTFGRWGAIVTLKDGYNGHTYPFVPPPLDGECETNKHLTQEDNGCYSPEIILKKTERILLWWVVWEEWKDEECRSTCIARELVAADSAERAVQIVLDKSDMEWSCEDKFNRPLAFRFSLPSCEGIVTEDETETSRIKLTYGGFLRERYVKKGG